MGIRLTHTAEYFKISGTIASINNLNSAAANGSEIKYFGLRSVKAMTDDGNKIKVGVNVANVKS